MLDDEFIQVLMFKWLHEPVYDLIFNLNLLCLCVWYVWVGIHAMACV